MNGRLVYIVGPSGAGKDSVIEWARAHLPPDDPVRFARRTITRMPQEGGEQHLGVSEATFGQWLHEGRFALHWEANGHRYGVGQEIRHWLEQGMTVVVNGSRAHLPCAIDAFPDMIAVHIGAPPVVIEERLRRRGRENAEEVRARMTRSQALAGSDARYALRINNDGSLPRAGARLLELIREGSPVPSR